MLAAPASAMCDAVGRAACTSCLGAALVLAAPAPSMRLAVGCAVSVNMFGPLLRLPGPFSASFQCYSLTSRGVG
jgi:hypothetical protein